WNTFWTIALPGALPVILTGFKLGIGIGLVLIAIAEMIGAKSGLGYLIWSAWETLPVEQMYVGLFMIAFIGFVLTLILNELERVIMPWKADWCAPTPPPAARSGLRGRTPARRGRSRLGCPGPCRDCRRASRPAGRWRY